MAVSSIDAGKTLCELSGWSMTNLELQKILYIAHMCHLGVHDKKPLINETFEAWTYGPVEPVLYYYVRGFGSNPIDDIFPLSSGTQEGSREYEMLNQTFETVGGWTGAELVSFTHSRKSAWSKVYKPGRLRLPITDDKIKEEYDARRRTKQTG